MKTKKAWKSLKLVDGQIKSNIGNCVWQIGEWKKENEVECCKKGFHSSNLIIDAMNFIACEIIAEVEYDGKTLTESDKQSSQKMRIIRAWKWTKVDSMKSCIFYVKQSMKYVDKTKSPEVFAVCLSSIKAIEAVILHDCEVSRSAARSAAASAAWSAAASAARSAAASAAWSAESAARSAESAAWSAESAAWSAARSAAWSAESAAWSAARSATKKLQHIWLKKYIIKNCEPILCEVVK